MASVQTNEVSFTYSAYRAGSDESLSPIMADLGEMGVRYFQQVNLPARLPADRETQGTFAGFAPLVGQGLDRFGIKFFTKRFEKDSAGDARRHDPKLMDALREEYEHSQMLEGLGGYFPMVYSYGACDFGDTCGWGILMERANGITLNRLVNSQQLGSVPGTLPTAREAALSLCGAARALCIMAARGVVHRDLSPGNVMLDLEGFTWDDEPPTMIVDFGSSALTGQITTLGQGATLWFGAPEMLGGGSVGARVDSRVDVYSLGCLLYFARQGERPFDRRLPDAIKREDDAVKARQQGPLDLREGPSFNESDIWDDALRKLVLRCTAFDIADRPYPREVAKELYRIAGIEAPELPHASRGSARLSSKSPAVDAFTRSYLDEMRGSAIDFAPYVETIAHRIHAKYNAYLASSGTEVPYATFDEMPFDLQESNRDCARSYPTKMSAIGCRIVRKGIAQPQEEIEAFSKSEVEVLAFLEHARWCKEREARGWVYGEQRDADRRISPWLVPYDELPEFMKEYDRQVVLGIIENLGESDLAVVRI